MGFEVSGLDLGLLSSEYIYLTSVFSHVILKFNHVWKSILSEENGNHTFSEKLHFLFNTQLSFCIGLQLMTSA